MDISHVLQSDRRRAERLLAKVKAGNGATDEIRGDLDELRKVLTEHTRFERETLTPFVRRHLGMEREASRLTTERERLLQALDVNGRLRPLEEAMTAYFETETRDFVPRLRTELTSRDAEELGDLMLDREGSERRTPS